MKVIHKHFPQQQTLKGQPIKKTTKFHSYFKKLNIKPKKLSLKLLAKIQKKHLATFSFNNIAVLLDRPISLDIDDILDKIVTQNLGGYCFEHNKLMHDALLSLGFDVRIAIARVLNNLKVDSPRTHRVTLVKLKGKEYLIDVGFGAMTPTLPLEFSTKEIINNDYKISQNSSKDFVLEIQKKDDFFTLYKFNTVTYLEADCIMGNFYSCSHPKAVFVNNFVVSKKMKHKTLSLRNNCYHKISKNNTKRSNIMSAKQLNKILLNDFNINLSKKKVTILFENAEIFRNR